MSCPRNAFPFIYSANHVYVQRTPAMQIKCWNKPLVRSTDPRPMLDGEEVDDSFRLGPRCGHMVNIFIYCALPITVLSVVHIHTQILCTFVHILL